MEKKTSNFGFRGWMLIVYQFIAFFAFLAFTNWPMNALADMYGGSEKLSTIYTVAMIIGILIQLILSRNIGKVSNIKILSIILGVVSMIFALGIMVIPAGMQTLWQIAYFLECVVVTVWCTFILGILVGQWFPRRKGTAIGIATIAFPVGNALLAPFAGVVFANMATTHVPNVTGAYIPYFIISCIGIVIGAVFIKDYPEQCGAYRDNDRCITADVAQAMMEQEIKDKKTTVWTLGNTLKNRDFWFITIPMGLLLLGAVGMMTQTVPIIGSYGFAPNSPQFGMIMLGIAVVASIGSWLLGVYDTRFGTRKAMLISVLLMVISGIFGAIGTFPTLLIALACLAVFMGAASNFTVSGAVQYWRREDFPSVFARVNPIANLIQAFGPMVIAILLFSKGTADPAAPFIFVGICGAISLVLLFLFKASNVKESDDKYRKAAGKTLDDVLVGRK
jgi:MFS transporter, OFA family, oxalate/formate antiporter